MPNTKHGLYVHLLRRLRIAKSVIPQVATWYRHASTLAVVTGAILLVTSGYLFPSLTYATEVATPPARPRCCGPACWALWPCGCSCTCTSGRTCRSYRPAHRRRGGEGARSREGAAVRPAQPRARHPRHAGDGGGGAPLLTWTAAGTAEPLVPIALGPRAPASPIATLPPCWPRRRSVRACWRWRHSAAELGRIGHLSHSKPMMSKIHLHGARCAAACRPGDSAHRQPGHRCTTRGGDTDMP